MVSFVCVVTVISSVCIFVWCCVHVGVGMYNNEIRYEKGAHLTHWLIYLCLSMFMYQMHK